MNDFVKPIAFYLPQFHRVDENDVWWGKGFTEWTNVAKAKPNFKGHYQPHIPREMGFYDLDNVERMREQAQLAQEYGVYGFCFYYYRFKDGKRILEKPLNNYLRSDIDFPFCYCWANENWTKTWDGLDKEVLLEQNHGGEDDVDFIKELLDVFKDDRYIKVDGKPMLLVYRADLLVDSCDLVAKWQQIAIDAGLPGLHLCAVQFYGIDDPKKFGFDAAVEFPPHNFIGSDNVYNESLKIENKKFKGGLIDYRKVVSQALNKSSVDYLRYRGIVPSWDNTARRQDTGHIMIGSTPNLYRLWLDNISKDTIGNELNTDNILFINAWNEWAEGAHLEPDHKYGLKYLEATLEATQGKKLDIRDYIKDYNLVKCLFSEFSEYELKQFNYALKHYYEVEQNSCDLGVIDAAKISFIDEIKSHVKKYPKLVKLIRLARNKLTV